MVLAAKPHGHTRPPFEEVQRRGAWCPRSPRPPKPPHGGPQLGGNQGGRRGLICARLEAWRDEGGAVGHCPERGGGLKRSGGPNGTRTEWGRAGLRAAPRANRTERGWSGSCAGNGGTIARATERSDGGVIGRRGGAARGGTFDRSGALWFIPKRRIERSGVGGLGLWRDQRGAGVSRGTSGG